MSIHQNNKTGGWECRYYVRGFGHRSKYFGTGEENYKSALEFDSQINKLRELDKLNARHMVRTSYNIGEIIQRYYTELKRDGEIPEHLVNFLTIIEANILPHITHLQGDEITADDMGKVLESIRSRTVPCKEKERPISNTTVNRYRSYFNKICTYGIEMEFMKKNPTRFWRKLREDKREMRLTADDVQKIVDVSPSHLQWAIIVAIKVIARVGESELFSLKWSDIDYDKEQIRYYMPKVRERKTVPLSPDFLLELRDHQQTAKTEYIIEFRGRPIKSIKRAWQSAVKRAGLDYTPRPYDLRHVAISALENAGVPVSTAAKLAGHKDITTTLNVYTHSLHKNEQEAVNHLPSFAI